MALNKAQLQALIEKDCTQQGAVSVPGSVLKELVDNYIESVATSKADAAEAAAIAAAAITAASLADAAAGAIIVEQDAIVDLVTESATAPQIATAVNSILAALRTNGILATE
jgi:hypothetical protein